MNTSQESRARKEATIEVEICDVCFAAIPADQSETHAQWHTSRALVGLE